MFQYKFYRRKTNYGIIRETDQQWLWIDTEGTWCVTSLEVDCQNGSRSGDASDIPSTGLSLSISTLLWPTFIAEKNGFKLN